MRKEITMIENAVNKLLSALDAGHEVFVETVKKTRQRFNLSEWDDITELFARRTTGSYLQASYMLGD